MIAYISKVEVVVPKFFDEEYQEYLRLKSNNLAQSFANLDLSTTCFSQFVEVVLTFSSQGS